jgi:2,5-diamino-6-(ribosylamino)-4(3H)-pyrimidinone 5'-phosphate reductase
VPRPHVFTHMLLSVDGRLDGFPPDVGRYYELAAQMPHQAVLAGSGTMVAAAADAGVDLSDVDGDPPRAPEPGGEVAGPLLVVVDSGGQLTRFDWLRASGFFADVPVLGSQRTPEAHRHRLRSAGVDLEVVGRERVDLAGALTDLHEQRGIDTVRVDAGPGLNGALLAAGLLDEVSVLLAPYLVGDGRSFLDGLAGHPATRLELAAAEPQPDGHVWLRYAIGRD